MAMRGHGRTADRRRAAPDTAVMHGDRLALALAASPLALSLPALSGGAFASLAVVPALISVQAILMLFDRLSLEPPGGEPPAAPPSPALYLLPGAYLADRARAFGRSDDLVWAWTCAMLHSIAILALTAAMLGPAVGAASPTPQRPKAARVDVPAHEAAGRASALRVGSAVRTRGAAAPGVDQPLHPTGVQARDGRQ